MAIFIIADKRNIYIAGNTIQNITDKHKWYDLSTASLNRQREIFDIKGQKIKSLFIASKFNMRHVTQGTQTSVSCPPKGIREIKTYANKGTQTFISLPPKFLTVKNNQVFEHIVYFWSVIESKLNLCDVPPRPKPRVFILVAIPESAVSESYV